MDIDKTKIGFACGGKSNCVILQGEETRFIVLVTEFIDKKTK